MHRGWIKLWRSAQDNPLYLSETFTKWQAWMDMLMLTNHQAGIVYVRGVAVHLKRGQLLSCERFLSDRWGWSRGKIRRFMQYLASDSVQQITQQKTNVSTVTTILNYELYQSDESTDDTARDTTDEPQTDTPKKIYNNNSKKPTVRKQFTPPTVGEVSEYVKERVAMGKPHIDPEHFVDHYESKGWIVGKSKMKDWKAAVRTFERNAVKYGNAQPQVRGL